MSMEHVRGEVAVEDLEIDAFHGCVPSEKEIAQRFAVSVWVEGNSAEAVKTDSVSAAIDYRVIESVIFAVMSSDPMNLLESLEAKIAEDIFRLIAHVDKITVKIVKPNRFEGKGKPSVKLLFLRTHFAE